ncbi:MAG TPA: hypothetical protein VJ302_06255 [Blastocatellia bacterium]|nr:hypothetical protein [Blastocatellia bacterium]
MKASISLLVLALVITTASARMDTPSDPVAMFMKLFDRLDEDRDGVVPLADLFEALNLKDAEARQIRRVRALDGNGDGKVSHDEAVAGVKAEIEYQTQRRMNTDADGDDELTPIEYALGVADPDGQANASGLTPLQQEAFKGDDLDGNGRITRTEMRTRVSIAYAGSYWALTMAVRARRADLNRDGAIDEQEFALLEGGPAGEPLSEDGRKRFRLSEAKNGRLTVENLRLLFIRMNEPARVEAERRMAAFEKGLEARPNPADPGGRTNR